MVTQYNVTVSFRHTRTYAYMHSQRLTAHTRSAQVQTWWKFQHCEGEGGTNPTLIQEALWDYNELESGNQFPSHPGIVIRSFVLFRSGSIWLKFCAHLILLSLILFCFCVTVFLLFVFFSFLFFGERVRKNIMLDEYVCQEVLRKREKYFQNTLC